MSSETIYNTTPSIIEDRRFYVYVYFDPVTREPFYVGKGTGKRAWDHLKETYYKNGSKTRRHTKIKKIHRLGRNPIIHIVYDNLMEQEAFQKEMSLIAHYGRLDNGTGCLTNLSDGGEGDRGRRFCIDKKTYTIYHQDGRLMENLTRRDIVDLFGNHQTAANFLRNGCSNGWYTDVENPPEKLYVPDDKQFELIHIPTGETHHIKKSKCVEFGFTIDGFLELIRNKKGAVIRFDYCLPENYTGKLKELKTVHSFRNTRTNLVVSDTLSNMNKIYNLKPYQARSLICGKNKMLGGWEYVQ